MDQINKYKESTESRSATICSRHKIFLSSKITRELTHKPNATLPIIPHQKLLA